MHLEIVKAGREDQQELLAFAKENFLHTYAHRNTPENIHHYIQEAFEPQAFKKELLNHNSVFYKCQLNEEMVGYYKINYAEAQTEPDYPESAEIERIYVSAVQKGKGIGRKMVDHAKAQAKAKGLHYLWLGVWQENPEAIRFYEKMGFEEIGTHVFQLGDDAQTDIIMKLML
ncbi:MAG: GNAT family N-acetyltransferase [Marinoscillum sp.]|uniref:GNAT family N-acetyltransferase n=1 Tax=Marinoscillum sp. TaxID=2024838 RepID=UPI003304F759